MFEPNRFQQSLSRLTIRSHTSAMLLCQEDPQPTGTPITMATPSCLKSKLVVGGRCKRFVHLFLSILYHLSLSFFALLSTITASILSPFLSAVNRCPAIPHKYLLITITSDSWSTQMDNLWLHKQFCHIYTCRGQMGLLRDTTMRFSWAAWCKHQKPRSRR